VKQSLDNGAMGKLRLVRRKLGTVWIRKLVGKSGLSGGGVLNDRALGTR